MRRLGLLLLLVLALTLPVGAQSYVLNLKITVAASAVGFADAASSACTSNACLKADQGHVPPDVASCVLTGSSGTIAYRIDGTDPTSTTGNELAAGSTLVITGNQNLFAFKAIRTGSTSGDLRCVLSSNR